MVARITPSKGAKPDKLMRDALSIELHEECEVIDPVTRKTGKVKKLRMVARALVHAGIAGDVAAIREINERMDGKVARLLGFEAPDGAGGSKPLVTSIQVAFVVSPYSMKAINGNGQDVIEHSDDGPAE